MKSSSKKYIVERVLGTGNTEIDERIEQVKGSLDKFFYNGVEYTGKPIKAPYGLPGVQDYIIDTSEHYTKNPEEIHIRQINRKIYNEFYDERNIIKDIARESAEIGASVKILDRGKMSRRGFIDKGVYPEVDTGAGVMPLGEKKGVKPKGPTKTLSRIPGMTDEDVKILYSEKAGKVYESKDKSGGLFYKSMPDKLEAEMKRGGYDLEKMGQALGDRYSRNIDDKFKTLENLINKLNSPLGQAVGVLVSLGIQSAIVDIGMKINSSENNIVKSLFKTVSNGDPNEIINYLLGRPEPQLLDNLKYRPDGTYLTNRVGNMLVNNEELPPITEINTQYTPPPISNRLDLLINPVTPVNTIPPKFQYPPRMTQEQMNPNLSINVGEEPQMATPIREFTEAPVLPSQPGSIPENERILLNLLPTLGIISGGPGTMSETEREKRYLETVEGLRKLYFDVTTGRYREGPITKFGRIEPMGPLTKKQRRYLKDRDSRIKMEKEFNDKIILNRDITRAPQHNVAIEQKQNTLIDVPNVTVMDPQTIINRMKAKKSKKNKDKFITNASSTREDAFTQSKRMMVK